VEARGVVWDEVVDWSDFDLCLVRSTWDYHEKHREFLAWTQQVDAASQLHNPPDLIAWNIEKTYLRELAEAGVPTVPTAWVDRDDETDLEQVLEPAVDALADATTKPL
jgi:hypothetical protein